MKNFIETMVYQNNELTAIVEKLMSTCANKSTLYLQGGYLRDIVSYKINKIPLPEEFSDYDFAIKGNVWDIESVLKKSGKVQRNFFGGIKWVPNFCPGVKVDIWFINEFWHLRRKKGDFNIDDFFKGVDFTMNQVAFEFNNNLFISTKESMESISNKILKLVHRDCWASREAIFVRIYRFKEKLQFDIHQNCLEFFKENKDIFDWNTIRKYATTKGIALDEIKDFSNWLNKLVA